MKIKNLITITLLAFCLAWTTGCIKSLGGSNTETRNEPITAITDVPDEKPGINLVKIVTESGEEAVVNVDNIPKDKDGIPVYPVVSTKPSSAGKAVVKGLEWVPGYGTLLSGIANVGLLGFTRWQRKKQQAEIEARMRGEAEISKLKQIGIAMAAGVEVVADSDEVKKAIASRMPKDLVEEFDNLTVGVRGKST